MVTSRMGVIQQDSLKSNMGCAKVRPFPYIKSLGNRFIGMVKIYDVYKMLMKMKMKMTFLAIFRERKQIDGCQLKKREKIFL